MKKIENMTLEELYAEKIRLLHQLGKVRDMGNRYRRRLGALGTSLRNRSKDVNHKV